MRGSEGVRKAENVATRQNFVKQLVHDGIAVVVYYPTAKMRTDIFTKPFARVKFEEQRERLGVRLIDIRRRGVEIPPVS